MRGEELQRCARERADELPGSELEQPFGPEWDVYKVRGKVFLLMTGATGEPIVTLKVEPQDGAALRSTHDDVTPGYHMNKRHWITLRPGGSLTERLVRELVLESYLLVVEKLPRARRPVDPDRYGRG